MKRVGQQQQSFDQLGLIGGQHAGLTAAVRLASKKKPSAHKVPQRRDRCAKPCAILRGVCRSRRSRWPLLTKGQIAAQDCNARALKHVCNRDQQRRITVASSAMGDDHPVAGAASLVEAPRTPSASNGTDEAMALKIPELTSRQVRKPYHAS